MTEPRVSIIVPSYNHAEFLPKALDSVRAQTFLDWELIVVDDCGSDGSVEIAREYAARDSRISVHVNEQNLGTYGTEERARLMAKGRYLAVLNSDDVWESTKLEKQVQAMESEKRAMFCYTLGWKVDENGKLDTSEDVHANWPIEPVQELLPYLLYENRVLASSVLFRTSAVRFDPTLAYSGDWVALLRLSRNGPALCISERLTFWRMHSRNSFVRSERQVNEEIRVRYAIHAARSRWFVDRVSGTKVRRGLGLNCRNIAALEVLRGRRAAGVKAAIQAVVLTPEKNLVLRRLVACMFVRNCRARLWPDDQTVFDGPMPELEPVDFE